MDDAADNMMPRQSRFRTRLVIGLLTLVIALLAIVRAPLLRWLSDLTVPKIRVPVGTASTDDGRMPFLSPSGRRLAFVREVYDPERVDRGPAN